MSYGQRKCANDELLSYFQIEAPIHRPSFFLFFSLTIKDKTNISLTIKILHLGQGRFTRKVSTIFALKIIVSIFVKLFLILVLHLRQFFIVRIFVKRATGCLRRQNFTWEVAGTSVRENHRWVRFHRIFVFTCKQRNIMCSCCVWPHGNGLVGFYSSQKLFKLCFFVSNR